MDNPAPAALDSSGSIDGAKPRGRRKP